MESFAEAAREACAGEIDGGELIRRAEPWVGRQARRLTTRLGRVPPWLGRQDVEQEIRIQLWRHVGKYEAGRCAPDKYLAFSASKVVQKAVQRAQGLEQHRRSGPPRWEVASGDGTTGPMAEALGASGDDAHREAVRAECYAVLRGLCETARERAAVDALEHEDGVAAGAAARLWGDREARLRLRLGSEGEAEAVVRRTVSRLIRDYGKEEVRT